MAPSTPVRIVDVDGNPITGGSGGDASAENQLTAISRLDDIETAVDIVAGAVSGAEMQADVVSIAVPAAVYAGQTTVTTPGTEVSLTGSQAVLSGVTIKALPDNTGNVYVGPNGLTSATGFVLAAGEQVFVEINNLATIYIDADSGGEGISWIAT